MKAVTKFTVFVLALLVMNIATAKGQSASNQTVVLENNLNCTLTFTNTQGETYLVGPGESVTANETTKDWNIGDDEGGKVIIQTGGTYIIATLNNELVEASDNGTVVEVEPLIK